MIKFTVVDTPTKTTGLTYYVPNFKSFDRTDQDLIVKAISRVLEHNWTPAGNKTGYVVLPDKLRIKMVSVKNARRDYTHAFMDSLYSDGINPVRISSSGNLTLWGLAVTPELNLHHLHVFYEFYRSSCDSAECAGKVLNSIATRPYVGEVNHLSSGRYAASILLTNGGRVSLSIDDEGKIKFSDLYLTLFKAVYDGDLPIYRDDSPPHGRTSELISDLEWVTVEDSDGEHHIAKTPFGNIVLDETDKCCSLVESPWGGTGQFGCVDEAKLRVFDAWRGCVETALDLPNTEYT